MINIITEDNDNCGGGGALKRMVTTSETNHNNDSGMLLLSMNQEQQTASIRSTSLCISETNSINCVLEPATTAASTIPTIEKKKSN